MKRDERSGWGPRGPARWLLERSLPEVDRAQVLRDMDELFAIRAARDGERAARRWYLRQGLNFGVRMLAERARGVVGRPSLTLRVEDQGGVRRSMGTANGRGVEFMNGILQDLSFAARTLMKSPGYSLVVIGTLGLGIGANSAVFSVINGVLLKPLPYSEGDRLVYLTQPQEAVGAENIFFSVHDIRDIDERARSMEDIAEYHSMSFTLLGRGSAELVRTGVVSAHFFDLMGMEPILGRGFMEADDDLAAEPTLIMSYGYWQRRFGGDPKIVGEAFEMNGKMHTVVGILPPIPQFPRENDVYMPTAACPIRSSEAFRENRDARMMAVFGRMQDGITLGDVRRDLAGVMSQIAVEYPGSYSPEAGQRFSATMLKEELVQNARPTLLILLGTAALVLLIACANVANLALARMTKRTQEIAVRSALGASRTRLIQQLVTEHTVLALVGGALGLAIAWAGTDLLVAFASRFTPRAQETSMNGSVLAFTLLASAATGLLFGSIPAFGAGRNVSERLQGGRGTGDGRLGPRLQGMLVVVQLALSFTLLVGSGLLLRSFSELQGVDAGYNPENVLSMQVTVTGRNSSMTAVEREQFFLSILEQADALPGVISVGLTDASPLQNTQGMFHGVRPQGSEEEDGRRLPQAQPRGASEGYFRTMGIPLIAGRTFEAADNRDSEPVAVINQSLADALWPGENAVGRRMWPCSMMGDCNSQLISVIGVVEDVHELGLDALPPAQLYFSVRQGAFGGNVVVRTAGLDPLSLSRQLRDIVAGLDATVPVSNVTTLEQLREDSLAPRRLTLILLAIFAGVALLVSFAGIAGVMAFGVSQRTHEIGIRMALGAGRETVLRAVLGRGVAMIVVGLGLGVVTALVATRVMSGLVWGVSVVDARTFLATALILAPMAMIACYLPARKATRVDPVVAFRS